MGQLADKMLLFGLNGKRENWRECSKEGFLVKLLLFTTLARKRPKFACTEEEGRAQELKCKVFTCCLSIEW